MKHQLALLPDYLAAHIGLSLVALVAGIAVSVPLGIVVSRSRRLEPWVLGTASVVQTIPSLALLAFMVPALAALGAKSIGYTPALLGLSLYSVLPILRNTVAGLRAVDPAVVEAARGVGMTDGERLRRIELPLALPVMVAGIRTAAVWTVGTATLATPVGASSLGNYIFAGLQTRNYRVVLLGCVASAALALVLDGLIHLAEIGFSRRRRRLVLASAVMVGALAVFAIAPVVRVAFGGDRGVVVGAKTFTEQYIVSRIVAGRVADAGVPASTLDSLGSTVIFDALRSGDIDVYVDYTGTLWSTVLGHGGETGGRKEILAEVTRALRADHGIEVVAALGFENTYALAMRRDRAAALGIRKISDLGARARSLRVGGDYEIFVRPEWESVVRAYGLSFAEQRSMDPSIMYEAVATGQVDMITAFSTDGRIASYDLVVLEDDRGAIPPYDAVVLVGPRLLREHPAAVDALRGLAGAISADDMRRMNAAVDSEGRSPAAVAESFLRDAARQPDAPAPR